MLRVFSTFTGIGSPEMALRNIGANFESVGISEVDKSALLAYDAIHSATIVSEGGATKQEILMEIGSKNIAYNFSTGKSEIPKNEKELTSLFLAHKRSLNFGDIRGINERAMPDFDLFTYSFPCKNISIAGAQAGLDEGSDTQSSLLWECERIIAEKKPKFLLMENVKNLVGKKHIGNLNLWISRLSDLGYNSYWEVLNGKDFGVPQNRERVMMVSILKDKDNLSFRFPEHREEFPNILDILEPNFPETMFMSPHRYEHFEYVGSTDDYRSKNLVQVGILDKKQHSNKRVYAPQGISPTLNSMNGGNRQPKIYNDMKVRKLTPLECWRCMGYSDEDFFKAKQAGLSNSKLYERAGRGIVVPMLEDIFTELFKAVEI